MELARTFNLRKKAKVHRLSAAAFLAAAQRKLAVCLQINSQVYAHIRADARRSGIKSQHVALHLVALPYPHIFIIGKGVSPQNQRFLLRADSSGKNETDLIGIASMEENVMKLHRTKVLGLALASVALLSTSVTLLRSHHANLGLTQNADTNVNLPIQAPWVGNTLDDAKNLELLENTTEQDVHKGFSPWPVVIGTTGGQDICSGPLGSAPCALISQWIRQHYPQEQYEANNSAPESTNQWNSAGTLLGGPNSVINNPGQLFGGANSVFNNPGELSGDSGVPSGGPTLVPLLGAPLVQSGGPNPSPAPDLNNSPPDIPNSNASEIHNEVISRMQSFQNAIDALPKGRIILNAPSNMSVGETQSLEARVGFEVPSADFKKGLDDAGSLLDVGIKVSDEMEVILQGPAFTITATTPIQQAIPSSIPIPWDWNVTANEAGPKQILHIWAYALVNLPGAQTAMEPIATLSKIIEVKVAPVTWNEHLKETSDVVGSLSGIGAAVTGVLAFVFGWYGRLFRKGTKGDARPTKPSSIENQAAEASSQKLS